jgi:hypothetical protein
MNPVRKLHSAYLLNWEYFANHSALLALMKGKSISRNKLQTNARLYYDFDGQNVKISASEKEFMYQQLGL